MSFSLRSLEYKLKKYLLQFFCIFVIFLLWISLLHLFLIDPALAPAPALAFSLILFDVIILLSLVASIDWPMPILATFHCIFATCVWFV